MTGNSYPKFTGSIPAMITPMTHNGDIDYAAFERLIDWHVQEGSDALVIVGTSGESPSITIEEHIDLIKRSVDHAAGRIPIIAGVGGNSTKEAIHLHSQAAKAGAQAGLSVCPYYNKPTQEGIYQHFKAIAEDGDMPVILYNVPGRTVADISNETILKLAHEVPGIMGLKDATANIGRLTEVIANKPEHFQVYSGDDATAPALILYGGQANISVTANVAPRLVHELCMAAYEGDVTKVQMLNKKLSPLNTALFCESNPIPVKFALAQMGKTELGYRLPLLEPSQAAKETVIAALKQTELL